MRFRTIRGAPSGTNVHVYPSPILNESRMFKITKTLADAELFPRILLIGIDDGLHARQEPLDGAREIWRLPAPALASRSTILAKVARISGWAYAVWRALRSENVACVNAHSLSVLPLCVVLKLAHSATLIYDTHELETETAGSRGLRRRLSKIVERLGMRFVDQISVVNEAIASWYKSTYRLDHVHVVRNIPYRLLSPARTTLLRDRCNIPPHHLIFLYQGVIGHGRGISQLLRAFETAPSDKHLVCLGYGDEVGSVEAAAKACRNIHYHPAVPPADLASLTADADVGLSLIEDVSLSYRLCLPNKVFEYLGCGLPIIVSNLPSLRQFVEAEGCGWVVDPDSDELRSLIQALNRDALARKKSGVARARARYSWEDEEAAVLSIYRAAGLM